jgi:hypothetical protein
MKAAGFETATAGKVFHALTSEDAAEMYDIVYSLSASESPVANNNSNISVYTGNPDNLEDAINVNYATQFLAGYSPQPGGDTGFFLSVGLSASHSPYVVPQSYFDLYPIDQIQLPDTVQGMDLNDVPSFALQFINQNFGSIVAAGNWKPLVQAYGHLEKSKRQLI